MLAAGCAVFTRFLPFPEVPRVREKLEYLAKHGDDFDVIFIGSSQVNWQVMPSIFDRVAGEQGVPVRSFNAGVWAMMSPEDGNFLDEVLRRPHRRLRWIILELMPLASRNYTSLEGTRRAIYWHDWTRMRLLTNRFVSECAEAARGPKPFLGATGDCFQSLGDWLGNWSLFLNKSVNLGHGAILLGRELGRPVPGEEGSQKKRVLRDGNDFPKGGPALSGLSRFNYEQQFANYLATEQRFDAGDSASWAAVQGKLDRLAQENITPIMMIPATVALKRYLPREAEEQSLKVLDFSDPRKYPEFYMADHRLDWVHLNYAGSELFTEAMAQRFVEMIKADGTVPKQSTGR